MDKLMSDLKTQIIAQLNLQDIKPEDIGDDAAVACGRAATRGELVLPISPKRALWRQWPR